jgi:hypothetical protein
VEQAKAELVRAVPSPRGAPGPVAESVLAFEETLRRANDRMRSWLSSETEDLWRRCDRALEESVRRAERLRLDAPSLDYESLVTVLGDLMAPLEAFEDTDRALHRGDLSS